MGASGCGPSGGKAASTGDKECGAASIRKPRRCFTRYTMRAPNGDSDSRASLKHCKPKGMPTMVRHRSNPFRAAARASHRPLTSSQITFIRKEGTPPPASTSRPKGQNHSAASLKHWRPTGMPTMVMLHKTPANSQPIPCQRPANRNHSTLPKKFIILHPASV